MCPSLSRRCFLKSAAAGALSTGSFVVFAGRDEPEIPALAGKSATKVRVGRVFVGHPQPGWPSSKVDLDAEQKRFHRAFADLGPRLGDVEFIDTGLVQNEAQLARARETLRDVDGILVLHLTLGTGPQIRSLLDFGPPVMIYTTPYAGHEWHIVGAWQRQGLPVDVLASSRDEDLAVAVRPFRALHRLKTARVLHVSQGDPEAAYCEAIRKKFGTAIIPVKLPELQQAYEAADRDQVEADARRWVREARRVVEPTNEDVRKASRMYFAMKHLMGQHQAVAVTMNCLGMGLMDREMGYPCLGFVRLNNAGWAGVCEADLKSTMTQLLFTYLVGKTGFVTDPMFDESNQTIIHAHCVAATQLADLRGRPAPYYLRSHLEDGRGASLQVKLPVGQKVCMARLIGTDLLLYTPGDAVDSPLVERGCRTKLTMRVANADRVMHNWSCGLHRVVFYGDHTADLARFCRLSHIRLLREDQDDLRGVPGLEWEPHVHA